MGELGDKIAKEVLGWKRATLRESGVLGWDNNGMVIVGWSPETEIGQAMLIVKLLREKGITLVMGYMDKKFMVYHGWNDEDERLCSGDEPAETICRAAMMAWEQKNVGH